MFAVGTVVDVVVEQETPGVLAVQYIIQSLMNVKN